MLRKQEIRKDDKVNDIRSDEVQEILSAVPNWMIRWGTMVLVGLITLLIVLSIVIKYPDTIKGSVLLTTEVPPVRLMSKSTGQLIRLSVKEGQNVEKGTYLAEIENSVTKESVTFLQEILKLFSISDNKVVIPQIESLKDSKLVMGSIQQDYSLLKSYVHDYWVWNKNDYRNNKIANIKRQIENYNRLSVISKNQVNLGEKELKNAEEQYNSDRILFDKGVISKSDFFIRETVLTKTKQKLEDLNKIEVQNQITLTEYEKQLNDLEFEYLESERKVIEGIQQSLDNIINQISSWKQKYVFTAPYKGKVSLLSNYSESQFIEAKTPLFAIIPDNKSYKGKVKLLIQGIGKVKIGQEVNIRLDDYPYAEFGQVKGEVEKIAQVSGERLEYLVTINLPNGLKTTYGKQLLQKPELYGKADIITEDLRLIERLFYQLRKTFEKI